MRARDRVLGVALRGNRGFHRVRARVLHARETGSDPSPPPWRPSRGRPRGVRPLPAVQARSFSMRRIATISALAALLSGLPLIEASAGEGYRYNGRRAPYFYAPAPASLQPLRGSLRLLRGGSLQLVRPLARLLHRPGGRVLRAPELPGELLRRPWLQPAVAPTRAADELLRRELCARTLLLFRLPAGAQGRRRLRESATLVGSTAAVSQVSGFRDQGAEGSDSSPLPTRLSEGWWRDADTA